MSHLTLVDPLKINTLENFYFTFCSNSKLSKHFIRIPSISLVRARRRMFETYGTKWAFCYDSETFLPLIEKYGLTEVPLGTEQ